MPPGLTTRSIVVAPAGAAKAASASGTTTCRHDTPQKRRIGTKQAQKHSRVALLGLQAFDEIARHRLAAVEPRAGGLLNGVGGHRADAVGPGADHVDGLAGRQRRAVPARQGRLIVLGVDRVRDQPVLGAIEFVGGDAVRDDVVEDGIDALLDLVQASRRASARRKTPSLA